MTHRMTRMKASAKLCQWGVGMALLALWGGPCGSLALAQKPDTLPPGVLLTAPLAAPVAGASEARGRQAPFGDGRARDLRGAFKAPQQNASEAASVGHRLSAAQRETLRTQLKGLAAATPPSAADSRPTTP